MLQATGRVLEVKSENINGPQGSFMSTTVNLLTGKSDVIELRMGRDLPPTDFPREGDDGVSFDVQVTAFAFKAGGAGTRFTAVKRLADVKTKPVAAVG